MRRGAKARWPHDYQRLRRSALRVREGAPFPCRRAVSPDQSRLLRACRSAIRTRPLRSGPRALYHRQRVTGAPTGVKSTSRVIQRAQQTMSDDHEIRRRRAAYRAYHRGTKEMDVVLGRYARGAATGHDARRADRLRALHCAARSRADSSGSSAEGSQRKRRSHGSLARCAPSMDCGEGRANGPGLEGPMAPGVMTVWKCSATWEFWRDD